MGQTVLIRSDYRKLISSLMSEGLDDVNVDLSENQCYSIVHNNEYVVVPEALKAQVAQFEDASIDPINLTFRLAEITQFPEGFDLAKEKFITEPLDADQSVVSDLLDFFSLSSGEVRNMISSAGNNFSSHVALGVVMRPDLCSGRHVLKVTGGLPLGEYKVRISTIVVHSLLTKVNYCFPGGGFNNVRNAFDPRMFKMLGRTDVSISMLTRWNAEIEICNYESTIEVVKANPSSKDKKKGSQTKIEMTQQRETRSERE